MNAAAEPPPRSSLRPWAGVIPSARASSWDASSSSPATSFEGPVPAFRVDGHLHGIFADVQVDEVPGICGGIEHRAPRPPRGPRRACRAAGAVGAASVGSAGVGGEPERDRERERKDKGSAVRLEALFGILSSLFVRLFPHKYLTALGLSASPAHVSTADAARYVGVRGGSRSDLAGWMDGL
ncbi:hypothetical protein C8R45DRAFT_1113751 [Mycena sanguinolenta]|nr:hypothetical protein C8R45DRAFT_1113751 [Mycena sanguinolenta]